MPYRYRIRNWGPGGLRPSTLPLFHRGSPQYQIFTSEQRKNRIIVKAARYTDRQTDILLTEKKSHYRLICHRNVRDICTVHISENGE